MPFPNFHACRIKSPSLFDKESFRTLQTKTKGLTFISAKLKDGGKSTVQSFRYNKKFWTSARATTHCAKRNGSFESATKKFLKSLTSSDIPNLLTPGANTAFQGKGIKGLVYKLCILENVERGKNRNEAREICAEFNNAETEIEKLDLQERKIELFIEKEIDC